MLHLQNEGSLGAGIDTLIIKLDGDFEKQQEASINGTSSVHTSRVEETASNFPSYPSVKERKKLENQNCDDEYYDSDSGSSSDSDSYSSDSDSDSDVDADADADENKNDQVDDDIFDDNGGKTVTPEKEEDMKDIIKRATELLNENLDLQEKILEEDVHHFVQFAKCEPLVKRFVKCCGSEESMLQSPPLIEIFIPRFGGAVQKEQKKERQRRRRQRRNRLLAKFFKVFQKQKNDGNEENTMDYESFVALCFYLKIHPRRFKILGKLSRRRRRFEKKLNGKRAHKNARKEKGDQQQQQQQQQDFVFQKPSQETIKNLNNRLQQSHGINIGESALGSFCEFAKIPEKRLNRFLNQKKVKPFNRKKFQKRQHHHGRGQRFHPLQFHVLSKIYYWYQQEGGKMSLENLRKVCQMLHIRPQRFLRIKRSMQTNSVEHPMTTGERVRNFFRNNVRVHFFDPFVPVDVCA
jgi:hypothetical protein